MFEGMLFRFIGDFVAEGKRILVEDFVGVLPDVVGYTAMVCGAFIMISPMIGRNIMRPLGFFATISICCASILGAV